MPQTKRAKIVKIEMSSSDIESSLMKYLPKQKVEEIIEKIKDTKEKYGQIDMKWLIKEILRAGISHADCLQIIKLCIGTSKFEEMDLRSIVLDVAAEVDSNITSFDDSILLEIESENKQSEEESLIDLVLNDRKKMERALGDEMVE